jgi:hypothetical protein
MAPMMEGDSGHAVLAEPAGQWSVSVAVFGHAVADDENGDRLRWGKDGPGYRVAIRCVQRQGMFVHGDCPVPYCSFPLPGVATPAVSTYV